MAQDVLHALRERGLVLNAIQDVGIILVPVATDRLGLGSNSAIRLKDVHNLSCLVRLDFVLALNELFVPQDFLLAARTDLAQRSSAYEPLDRTPVLLEPKYGELESCLLVGRPTSISDFVVAVLNLSLVLARLSRLGDRLAVFGGRTCGIARLGLRCLLELCLCHLVNNNYSRN